MEDHFNMKYKHTCQLRDHFSVLQHIRLSVNLGIFVSISEITECLRPEPPSAPTDELMRACEQSWTRMFGGQPRVTQVGELCIKLL